ncbi:MAG: hypothetical protein ACOH5I_06535 [Oligoflexus sp.]
MTHWHKLWIGIDYGYGLMRVRFLPFLQKYQAWGHIGSIASFALYFPLLDLYVTGNFNQSKSVGKAMRFIMNTVRAIAKHSK